MMVGYASPTIDTQEALLKTLAWRVEDAEIRFFAAAGGNPGDTP